MKAIPCSPVIRRLRWSVLALLVAAGGFGAASLASAATIFSENFGSTSAGSLPVGWTSAAGNSVVDLSLAGVPFDGSNENALNLATAFSGSDVLSPAISFSLYAGQTVTLTFDAYNTQTDAPASALTVGVATLDSETPVSAWFGAYTVDIPGATQDFSLPANTWTTVTLDLTGELASYPATNALALRSWSEVADASSPIYITNITVSAVPEPSTWALLAGLAVLGVAFWRRRRARAAA